MGNTALNISTDLQIFMNSYDPSKFKIIAKGIEIRGISNIHSNILEARAIIDKLKLKLIVSHNAEMLTYRGFEVNNM